MNRLPQPVRFLVIALAVMALLPAAVSAQGAPASRVITIDLVQAKPGQLDRLLRYYELNWSRARKTALAQGGITGYQLLMKSDTVSRWDIALQTEYADSAAYAGREAIFQPVLAAQGQTLVEGMDRKALGDIVESRTLRVAITSPAH